ncbi:MAG: hypothetical protein HC831_11290 [Chloroflexia bacterium]|nr:hypothetical protein [Chloroflexia bacterium]
MKKAIIYLSFACVAGIYLFSSCEKEKDLNVEPESQIEEVIKPEKAMADPTDEFSGIITPEDELLTFRQSLKWDRPMHKEMTYIAAKKLGLSDYRANIMKNSADLPDYYQSGLDNGYNQQWSHAYLCGSVVWGDAEEDYGDNLDQETGGWWDSHTDGAEGYAGKSAKYYYERGNRNLGDWYVGYATHYVQDVSLTLHSSYPGYYMIAHHFDFESWVQNNWSSGWNFKQYAENLSVSNYYTMSLSSNPQNAVITAANNACYDNHNSNTHAYYAYRAWETYKSAGFPTSVGSGNSTLAYYTSKMIQEATKWTGATIKYGLSKYNQW